MHNHPKGVRAGHLSRRTLQGDLPADFQKSIGGQIEPIRHPNGIPIHESEDHAPPSSKARSILAAHYLVASRKEDGGIEVQRAALLLCKGEGDRQARHFDKAKPYGHPP